MATASEIAKKLKMTPHPEGGFYIETFRDTSVLLSKSQLPSQCNFLPLLFFFELFTFAVDFLLNVLYDYVSSLD